MLNTRMNAHRGWCGDVDTTQLALGRSRSAYYIASAAVTADSSPCHHPLRAVDSVHLRILSMGTCRQCGSWSVAGHNHVRKVTGRDPICASQHKVGLDLSVNGSSETTYDEGEREWQNSSECNQQPKPTKPPTHSGTENGYRTKRQ